MLSQRDKAKTVAPHVAYMYIIFKWIRWLDEQKENSNASRFPYNMAGTKESCWWMLFLKDNSKLICFSQTKQYFISDIYTTLIISQAI